MSNRAMVAATLAVLVMGLAGPASAAHTPAGGAFAPEYVETATYLHCNGPSKLSNVHTVGESKRVSFDTTKPTASYTTGAGCGTVDTFLNGTARHNPIYDFPVHGAFTGNIDNITIRYWGIDFCGSRATDEWDMDLHLVIDGVDILTRPTVTTVPMVNSSNGIARLYEVTVTKIGLKDLEAHQAEHEIELTVYPKYVDGSGCIAWVYDAAEIDSGLVINDTTPSAVKIPRNA